jgi:hypothetical protein
MARTWTDALITVGKWRHDIVLLGDEGAMACGGENVRVIDIVQDVAARYQLPAENWVHWTLNNLKGQIGHYVCLSDYDYVLYLDIDVLVNRPHLEAAVTAKWQRGMIAVQEDCEPLDEKRVPALEKLGMPDEAELARWAKRPICSGVMGFPMTPTGRAAFEEYIQACIAMRFAKSDQAKLVAILNRNYAGKWEFFEDTTHGRRAIPAYKELLIHFTGQRDALFHAHHRLHHRRPSWLIRCYLRGRLFFEQLVFDRTATRRAKAYWR